MELQVLRYAAMVSSLTYDQYDQLVDAHARYRGELSNREAAAKAIADFLKGTTLPALPAEIEPIVGVHVFPDQRCQRVQVSGVQSAGPVRASENPLEHLQREELDGVGRERAIA